MLGKMGRIDVVHYDDFRKLCVQAGCVRRICEGYYLAYVVIVIQF